MTAEPPKGQPPRILNCPLILSGQFFVVLEMKIRILVVEDDTRIALLIKDGLADLGENYHVEAVGSAEEALRRIERAVWDLVITDQQMPGMTGLELIQALKDKAPGVLTILMTGFGSEAIEQAAARLNVNHYVTKPFTLEALERVVLAALEIRRNAHAPAPVERKEAPPPVIKVTLAGDGNVGKTTLIRRLCAGTFDASRVMTIGVDFHVYDVPRNQHATRLIIWDVSGQDQFAFTRRAFYRGSRSVGLAYDVSTRSSFERLPQWRAEIQSALPRVPIVLVGNKIDLPRQVETEEGRALAQAWNVAFFETSSFTGDGVKDLFSVLADVSVRRMSKQK